MCDFIDECSECDAICTQRVTNSFGEAPHCYTPLKEKEAHSSVSRSAGLEGPMAEWISVETIKPIESGEYLVYWDGIKIRGDRVPGVACYQVAYWRREMNKFIDPDGRKKWRTPDYWMKLPEPPQAD